jgi:hypothetical protein
MKRRRL